MDGQSGQRDEAKELEQRLAQELERLPGVIGAAVWLDDLKTVRDVNIIAARTATAGIVARSAEQILAKHGLAFAGDRINVAYADEPAPAGDLFFSSPRPGGRYLVLQDLTVTRAGSQLTCSVQLTRRSESFSGDSRELDTETGRARAAARATLHAAQLAGHNVSLGLEGIALLELFGRRYVAVSVEAAIGRRFAILSGIVPVEAARSLEEAASLAALRAVERWIAF